MSFDKLIPAFIFAERFFPDNIFAFLTKWLFPDLGQPDSLSS